MLTKIKTKKIGRLLLIILLSLNVLGVHTIFAKAQMPIEDSISITDFQENNESNRTIDYTEDLWEITDMGVFDDQGRYIEEIAIDNAENSLLQNIEAKIENTGLYYNNESIEAYKQNIINNLGESAFAKQRLMSINEKISKEFEYFQFLEDQISDFEEKLDPIHEEIDTLKGQVDLLNQQVRTTKTKITNAELIIAEKQIEIRDLMLETKKNKIELDVQRKVILDYVNLLYSEEEQFFDFYDEGTNTLKLLLADASISENLLGQEYMAIMEQTGRKLFQDLEVKNYELAEKQDVIQSEQRNLKRLYIILNQEKRSLEETRYAKKELLTQTKGEENLYQHLLDESLSQQLEAVIAIQNMQDNIGLIEEKLENFGEGLSADLNNIESRRIVSKIERKKAKILGNEEYFQKIPFAWPVEPKAITAYYHDSTYPKRWGIHNAIDIRAKHFTEIYAPADGYVAEVKDNGMGYSYIILAHKDNLMTVYGHISDIKVKAGDLVREGKMIGLSGGTPGTKGAGWQTTGPHLHFEVHYKGEAVNPLDYLPVEELPNEYIPMTNDQ